MHGGACSRTEGAASAGEGLGRAVARVTTTGGAGLGAHAVARSRTKGAASVGEGGRAIARLTIKVAR